jgi:hypothetical protein
MKILDTIQFDIKLCRQVQCFFFVKSQLVLNNMHLIMMLNSEQISYCKSINYCCIQFSWFLPTGQIHGYLFSRISYCAKAKKKFTFQSTSLLADDVLYWQDKIDIKLSTIKPIHASWIIPAFQQVTKETLIRGWEKTCIKECVDNCRLWLP